MHQEEEIIQTATPSEAGRSNRRRRTHRVGHRRRQVRRMVLVLLAGLIVTAVLFLTIRKLVNSQSAPSSAPQVAV